MNKYNKEFLINDFLQNILFMSLNFAEIKSEQANNK